MTAINRAREAAAHLQERFRYTIEQNRIRFSHETRQAHRKAKRGVLAPDARKILLHALTAPFIYSVIVAFVTLDAMMSLYQTVCFPVYGIPKVKRSAYMAFDRHKLAYLNVLQKINCEYCAYGNGVLAYASEIASRTEFFWCPIKHASHDAKCETKYYDEFLEFGQSENLMDNIEVERKKCRACENCH